MSRNPYATALRYVRQQIVPDKRPNAATEEAMREAREQWRLPDMSPEQRLKAFDDARGLLRKAMQDAEDWLCEESNDAEAR